MKQLLQKIPCNICSVQIIKKTHNKKYCDACYVIKSREWVRDSVRRHPEEAKARTKKWRKSEKGRLYIKLHNKKRIDTKNMYIRKSVSRKIKSMYGNMCLCCKNKNSTDITIDHIIPLSLGGNSQESNLQTLCRICNSLKGNKIIDYR
jgi:5-methylcytosine-specific restriction endonuclease McrA